MTNRDQVVCPACAAVADIYHWWPIWAPVCFVADCPACGARIEGDESKVSAQVPARHAWGVR
jgi:hypothetical protein